MTSLTVEFDARLGDGPKRRPRRGAESDLPVGRVPRVARLMALAIRLDLLIQDGNVDQAALATAAHVSRTRLTQVVNLTLLAPSIQEALLSLPPTVGGRDPVHEKQLRSVAATPSWAKQRRMWEDLVAVD